MTRSESLLAKHRQSLESATALVEQTAASRTHQSSPRPLLLQALVIDVDEPLVAVRNAPAAVV